MASHQAMARPVAISKTIVSAVLTCGILLCCAGCGTVVNGIFGIPRPYAGVRIDIEAIKTGGAATCMVFDLPFSAVADTLLLPVDLPNAPPLRDPLNGWQCLGSKTARSYQPADAIQQDLERYIRKQKFPYPPSDGDIVFYEDGTGRHAVRFEIAFDGYRRCHILIYDKSNVRAKARKFITGSYMC